jgi:hypothetical protein
MGEKALWSMTLAMSLAGLQAQLLYETSFENPPFTPGNIAGQDGWQEYHLGVANRGQISTERALSGTQSLKITPVNGGANSWWWKTVPHDTRVSPNKIIDIRWDMYLLPGTAQGAIWHRCLFKHSSSGYAHWGWDASNAVILILYPDGVTEQLGHHRGCCGTGPLEPLPPGD